MVQVTAKEELAELQARVAELVRQRDETIKSAYALIREANRQFDEMAVELGRRINEIRADMEPEPAPEKHAPQRRSTRAVAPDGLDEDDQAHFLELLAKRKARK